MRGWVRRSGACVIVAVTAFATACGPSGPVGETSTPGPAEHATAPDSTSTGGPDGGTAPTALRLATEPPEAIDDGVLVIVAGQACRRNDGVVRLLGAVVGTYPPQCGGGVEVDGLDVESVPGVEYFPPSEAVDAAEVTWAVVTLLGTWDGKRLHVEELNPPAPPEFTRLGEDGWCAGGSCAPLDLGAPTTCPEAPSVPEDTTEQPGFDVLDAFDAYQQARPDVSASRWLHQGRVWMAFTDDPGTHVDQLCAIDPTVAIVRVPHSLRELEDLQAQLLGFADAGALNDATAAPTGDAVSDFQGSGIDIKNSRVAVSVTFADQARVDELLQRHGADRLSVHSWMVPVATSR
jgi:hypothetical protein